MANIYKGTLGLVGNTPLVEVVNVEKALGLEATVLVKLEYLNPAGSVKDRIAKGMIEDAEKRGVLKEGSVIIEPTSGNTGIGISHHPDDAGDDERGAPQHSESVRCRDCPD